MHQAPTINYIDNHKVNFMNQAPTNKHPTYNYIHNYKVGLMNQAPTIIKVHNTI